MSTKILLADDSLTIQKVVELTFAETGHEVVAVSGGQELLDALPEVVPDIVICDVVMPGTDGYEVCQSIKSSPTTLHIPVILLTGTFEPFDRDRALAAGCDEIITKPFEARKLVEAVDRLTGVAGAEPVEAPVEDEAPAEEVEILEAAEEAAPELEEAPSAAEAEKPADIAAAPAAAAGFSPPEAGGDVAFAIGDEAAAADGLEFTTTGFAEMEEAGRKELGLPSDEPDEAHEPEAHEEEPPADEPPADLPEPDLEAAEATEAAKEEDDEPTMVSAAAPEGESEVLEEPADEKMGVTTAPVEPPAAAAEEPPADVEEPPADAGEPQAWSAEEAPSAALPDDDGPTEPIETSAFAPPPFGAEARPEPEPEPEAPTPPPLTEPEALHTEADGAGAAAEGGLSDEDVERIARRVVELASERIEQIAWEVIPDMAEIVVRERIRELEASIEDQEDAVQ